MEEEERAAQSAKLQELIRRGGPEDLQEANRLMKVMAGYDTRHKTDYRAKAAEEVSKIQQKARLLEERLQNFKAGDSISDGDVYEVCYISIMPVPYSCIHRNLRIHYKVRNPKYRKCARKNQTIRRRSQNYLKSTTVSIVQSRDTSSLRKATLKPRRKSRKEP